MPVLMEMTAKQRLFYWPNLVKKSFKKKSNFDLAYNCASFVIGIKSKRIDSFGKSYEWPNDLPRDHTVNTYARFYEKYGYTKCENGELEPDKEKIALFVDDYGFFKHISLQLRNGWWTSKMGDLEDIIHRSPKTVSGQEYGGVSIYMSRERK